LPVGNLQQQQWSNETIQNILESSFVFWQRSTSSSAGQNFQRLYSSGAEEMPQIVIIGPTGAKILTHTGFIQADDLSMMLVEFLDSNDLDSTVAPTLNQSGRRSRSGSDLGSANGMGSRTSSVGAGMGGVGGGGGGGGGDMGMGDGRGGSGSGSGAAAIGNDEAPSLKPPSLKVSKATSSPSLKPSSLKASKAALSPSLKPSSLKVSKAALSPSLKPPSLKVSKAALSLPF
jgi:hypothetical protein